MKALGGPNLALAFALEIAMLWAYGWAGVAGIGGVAGWAAGLAAVAVAVALWAVLLAPKSRRRLRQPWLLVLKAVLFGGAALALAAAGAAGWGVALAAVAALNLTVAQVLGQEEM